jgi:outer membrane protein assembly factor BamB
MRCALLLALVGGPALASDWTQFRGPGSSGVSDETGLPVRWTATENVRWKADLPGRGLSSPVIAGGKVYVTACSGYRQTRLHVLCFDEATGARIWQRQFVATGPTMCHPSSSMAAPGLAADGKCVFALFGCGDLVGLDADGTLLWYRSLNRDYGNLTNQLGLAASLVLAGDTLLLPMENTGHSYAAGIDAKTGLNKWKVDRERGTNWVTPVVRNVDGRLEGVFATPKEITAYDVETGTVRWTHTAIQPSSTASPGPADGGLVIVPGRELCALRPSPDGTTPQVVWKTGKVSEAYASPVAYRGHVYAIGSVAVDCLDAKTGESRWKRRVKGKQFWASPIAGDGKLYVVSEDGLTTVILLGDKPQVLATNAIGDTIMATPAIANGCVYLRSDQHLYCIGSPKSAPQQTSPTIQDAHP